jgi:hypothetical protein
LLFDINHNFCLFFSLQQKPFDEGAVDFEEKILKHEIVAKSSLDETTSFHHWEDSSNCSQEDGNNSTSNCSQEDGNNSTSNCSQEDGNNSSKERLVIKFRRITGTYYMVDDIIPDSPDSSFKYFNYKSERYSFPEYLTVAPSPPAKKGTGSPKVRVGNKKPTQNNPPKKPTKNGLFCFFWVFLNFLFFF